MADKREFEARRGLAGPDRDLESRQKVRPDSSMSAARSSLPSRVLNEEWPMAPCKTVLSVTDRADRGEGREYQLNQRRNAWKSSELFRHMSGAPDDSGHFPGTSARHK